MSHVCLQVRIIELLEVCVIFPPDALIATCLPALNMQFYKYAISRGADERHGGGWPQTMKNPESFMTFKTGVLELLLSEVSICVMH